MFLWSCRQNKPTIDRSSTPGELKSPAMIRAEEVQSNLESAFPSFVKSLVRSHVGSCFWMVGLLNAWTWARLMTLSKEAPVDIYFDICFFFLLLCLWQGLPGPFCRAHLPREDTIITLEDECGKGFRMKYIAYKTGLSAGWRQFCVAHQLLEGDVLVFQLIEPCKFKVIVWSAFSFYVFTKHSSTTSCGYCSPWKYNEHTYCYIICKIWKSHVH